MRLAGTVARMRQEYDEAKFSEMVLYCAQLLESDRASGATKLNKLLYFADFAYIRKTGSSITGAEYQKLERGPAPRRLLAVRGALIEGGRAEIHPEFDGFGHRWDRLRVRDDPDLSRFAADEIATIDAAASELRSLTATQVSALSHEEPGWELVDYGETIPHASAYLATDAEVPPHMREQVARRAAELTEEHAHRIKG